MPGPRDAAAAMLLARGVLTRHEAEIRHQRAGRVEPPKVMQLGQDQDRRQRVDPAEAPQPADRFAIRLASAAISVSRASSSIEPRLELIDRQQIIVDDHALRRLRPRRDCRSTADARASSCARCNAARGAAATCPSRWRHRCRSSRASSRARHRSRTASSSGVGGRTSVSKPARSSSASLRASRRLVLTRSPGFRGISAGAIT